MVHPAAVDGYRRAASTYQRARPAYAEAILTEVQRRLPPGLVVELGAGTGILTARLVAQGRRVLAIEPVASMRSTLADAVPDAVPSDGTAEQIPAADGSAVAVVAAQSFHWFDADRALDEIARVLGPDGELLVLWNVRDQSVPWVAATTAIMDDAGHDEYGDHGGVSGVTPLACALPGVEIDIDLGPTSWLARLHGTTRVREHATCRDGLALDGQDLAGQGGLAVAGIDASGEVRVVERLDHPYFVAALCQPQLGDQPHPLFLGLVDAARRRRSRS